MFSVCYFCNHMWIVRFAKWKVESFFYCSCYNLNKFSRNILLHYKLHLTEFVLWNYQIHWTINLLRIKYNKTIIIFLMLFNLKYFNESTTFNVVRYSFYTGYAWYFLDYKWSEEAYGYTMLFILFLCWKHYFG